MFLLVIRLVGTSGIWDGLSLTGTHLASLSSDLNVAFRPQHPVYRRSGLLAGPRGRDAHVILLTAKSNHRQKPLGMHRIHFLPSFIFDVNNN